MYLNAILVSLILYAIWILLPLVVAIAIFKLFPTTTVSAAGPFSNLTINTTGAFAAYLITLLAGWSLISRIDARIQNSLVSPTWEVTAKVKLVDTAGKEIPVDHVLREDLKVFVEPPIARVSELPYVYIRLPLLRPGDWPALHFNAPGFIPEMLSTRRMIAEKKAKVDPWNQTVDAGEVVLRQAPKGPPPPVAPAGEKYLSPIKEGPPPASADALKANP